MKRTAKGSGGRRRGARKGSSRRGRIASWLAPLVLIGACGAAAWLFWLDHRVRERFEGRLWELPAEVYARPVELRTGQALSAAGLEEILRGHGYRNVETVSAPGQYAALAGAIELYRRGFGSAQGTEPELRVRIQFDAGRVSAITDAAQRSSLPAIELEPAMLGKIYPFNEEDRVPVAYRDIPVPLVQALLAAEDKRFFSHPGADPLGVLRALWINFRAGSVQQGGSTITQQLVKNVFLSNERSIARKLKELILSLIVEYRYTKAQILTAYVNEVYLGQQGARGIHGFGTAAQHYFGRPLPELALHELALLVGLVRGASYYHPWRHPERALERRNLVLDALVRAGDLDPIAALHFKNQDLRLRDTTGHSAGEDPAAFALDLVQHELTQARTELELRSAGLHVHTAIDAELQGALGAIVQEQLARLERSRNLTPGTLQAAIVIVDSRNGEITAVSGARISQIGSYNRARASRRPIGSLIKPFVYLTALLQPERYSVLSEIDDAPLRLDLPGGQSWEPRNFARSYQGRVTLLEALSASINTATVRLGMQLGLDRVIATLQAAGLERQARKVPALLLGAQELTALEVAQLYESLASGGRQVKLHTLRAIVDRSSVQRPSRSNPGLSPLKRGPVFLTNFMLRQATQIGTARALDNLLPRGVQAAGKTGTTNELRDSWFAGFGGNLLGVVWVGRDDNRPIGLTGASGAMQLWAAVMRAAPLQSVALKAPPGIGWLESVRVQRGASCVELGRIPYLLPHAPNAGPGC